MPLQKLQLMSAMWRQTEHYVGPLTVSMIFRLSVLSSVRELRLRHKNAPGPGTRGILLAEGKGFEPLVRGYRTLVFKTSSLGRSDNLPRLVVFHRELAVPKHHVFQPLPRGLENKQETGSSS